MDSRNLLIFPFLIFFILAISPSSVFATKIAEDVHCGWTGDVDTDNQYDLTVSSSNYLAGSEYQMVAYVAAAGTSDDSYGDVEIDSTLVGLWNPTLLTINHDGATSSNCNSYSNWDTVRFDVTNQITSAGTYSVLFNYTTGAKALQIKSAEIERLGGSEIWGPADFSVSESNDWILDTGLALYHNNAGDSGDVATVSVSGVDYNMDYELWLEVYHDQSYFSLAYSHVEIDSVDYDWGASRPDLTDGSAANKWYEHVKGISVSGGSYSFDVKDDQTTSGAYIYNVKLVPANDNYEPDGEYQESSTITNGVQQTHNINDGGKDIDWMKFTLGSTSDVTIETSGPSGYDTRMWLYDSSGVPSSYMEYNDDGGTGLYSKITQTSLPADTYYVKIDEYYNNDIIPIYYVDLTVTASNSPPTASIDSISPSPATQGQTVDFYGSGTDSDGTVEAYNWTSNLDGELSTLEDFSTSSLSVGTHTIYFKVKDDDNAWSTEVSDTLTVNSGGGGGGGECEGVVPMLVGKPDIVDNYDDCWPDCSPEESWNSFMTFINTIWAAWGIGLVKYVDVDIKSKISYEECVSSVEGSIEHPDKHLEQTPLSPNPDPDYNYRGNYVYWAVFDEQVENWDKEKEIGDIITVLIEVATDKNLDKTEKILKMAKFLNKYFPNLPPALYLTNITTTDTSDKSHLDPVDPKMGVPTYLSDLADKILVFRSFSPVDIAVIDPAGNNVGMFHVNNTVVEINDFGNNSFYTGNETESQIILLANPEFGNYTIEVTGTADGKYDFKVIKIINGSRTNEEFINVNILEDEKHIYYLKYGLQEANIYALMYGTHYSPDETVSSRIYVENSGGVDIDDELVFTIIDPSGERIYKKRKPIYIEADEMLSFKFDWFIPADAPKGHYWLRVEFDDLGIDFLPLTKSFWVD